MCQDARSVSNRHRTGRGPCNSTVIKLPIERIIVRVGFRHCPCRRGFLGDTRIPPVPRRCRTARASMLDALNMHTSCGSSISSIKPLRWTFDRITAYGRRLLPFRAALLCTILAATWVPSVSAAPLDDAAEHYRRYLIEDIERALIGARVLRERIGAGDLEGAKRAWIEARIGWERSEVFNSGFVPELDQQIDAWPNAINGFHGIEAKLFGTKRIEVVEETDSLVVDLADLRAQVRNIRLTPQRLLNGIARLAFEIGGSKADGGESRLSGTSLNDMQSNADGIELAYRIIFSAAVEASAPQQGQAARAINQRLKADVKVSDLRNLDLEKLCAHSEELIALLQSAAPNIGLSKPTLEEAAQ